MEGWWFYSLSKISFYPYSWGQRPLEAYSYIYNSWLNYFTLPHFVPGSEELTGGCEYVGRVDAVCRGGGEAVVTSDTELAVNTLQTEQQEQEQMSHDGDVFIIILTSLLQARIWISLSSHA